MTFGLILHRQIRVGSCPGVQAEPKGISGMLSERNAPRVPRPSAGLDPAPESRVAELGHHEVLQIGCTTDVRVDVSVYTHTVQNPGVLAQRGSCGIVHHGVSEPLPAAP